MTAQIWQIVSRGRSNPAAWVHPSDFTCVKAGSMAAADVLAANHITLYTLDHVNEQFVFVETNPNVDLTEAPFYFQAQFEHAQRLITIPCQDLHRLVDGIEYEDDQLILLYSVGRCGSTLLSDGFNQLDGVASLSEPDVFTNLLWLYAKHQDRAWLERFVRTAVIALMKPRNAQKYAIKFRSYGIELAEVLYSQFPDAHTLFMYRNAEDWARSTARAFEKLTSKRASVGTGRERIWASLAAQARHVSSNLMPASTYPLAKKVIRRLDKKAGVLSHPSINVRRTFYPAVEPFVPLLQSGKLPRMAYISLEWVSGMIRFLKLREAGMPLIPFRYEELIEDPDAVLGEICAACSLPRTAVFQMLSVFDKDSQRGTSLARDIVRKNSKNYLTEAHLEQLRATVAAFPEIGTPHFILPGSIATCGEIEHQH